MSELVSLSEHKISFVNAASKLTRIFQIDLLRRDYGYFSVELPSLGRETFGINFYINLSNAHTEIELFCGFTLFTFNLNFRNKIFRSCSSWYILVENLSRLIFIVYLVLQRHEFKDRNSFFIELTAQRVTKYTVFRFQLKIVFSDAGNDQFRQLQRMKCLCSIF